MGSIADDVAAAKASFSSDLASAKYDAALTVAEAKSALLGNPYENALADTSSPTYIPNLREKFSDAVTQAREEFRRAMPNPKKVISQQGNVQTLADGTFNIITATGKVLRSVDRKYVNEFLAIEQQRAGDLEKQERLESKATPITDMLGVGVDVIGKIIGGGAQIASDITGIGTPAQTVTEAVDRYNQSFVHERSKASMSESMRLDKEPPPHLISKESLTNYQNIVKKIGKGTQLSPAETNYVQSEDFNIISGLTILVKNKTREIAILKSIGVLNKSITKIFFLVGVIIGTSATLFGIFLGVMFSLYIENLRSFLSNIFNISLFPEEIYFLSTMPSEINPSSIFVISICSIIITILVSIFPAIKASKLDPVKALKYE